MAKLIISHSDTAWHKVTSKPGYEIAIQESRLDETSVFDITDEQYRWIRMGYCSVSENNGVISISKYVEEPFDISYIQEKANENIQTEIERLTQWKNSHTSSDAMYSDVSSLITSLEVIDLSDISWPQSNKHLIDILSSKNITLITDSELVN
tara:strand:+ start:300 stop:755 length:456 start_codon:yes stop_codon:yes gene_type:complete